MLLIAEILLTIFAWRKGWKWYALIPLCATVLIGLLIGVGIGASGGTTQDAFGIGVVLDIIAVVVLIGMVSKGPKLPENTTETTKNV